MLGARIALIALGAGVVAWTMLSAIRTVILPRAAQVLITRWVFRVLGIAFRVIANERRTYRARDRVMALYAPIGLVVLPGVWLALVMLGYALIYWGIDGGSFGEAVGFSGSSITTLGFVAEASPADRIPAFSEAGFGLFLAALMVAYLPSLYAAFARREAEVSLLEVRAGGPPTAVEFIERQHRIDGLDRLTDTWVAWERWFADIEESHTSYPALAFFRSPQPERSWVVAAGAVLDSAAMYLACVRNVPPGPAALCIRAGYLALRRIAGMFGIEYDPEPAPTDPISITRAEFDEAWRRLDTGGVPLAADRNEAWRTFAGWRVNYDTVLLSLAEVFMAPVAPWTSDRSAPGLSEPKVRRFGRRLHGTDAGPFRNE
jgi:hypothetical protein